jgi:hypothetical protein
VPGHKRHAARVEGESIRAAKSEITDVALKKELLPGEGKVGAFKELNKLRVKGDNLTPDHIPQAAFIEKHGIKYEDGMAMMMEHPFPGKGGRHRQSRTYGKRPDADPVSFREELAKDILDRRKIYYNDGVYDPKIRQGLQDIMDGWNKKYPELLLKK